MQKTHHPLIRTIYLYLFSLLGLVFLIIGAVRFIDMGLKAFVFTQAEIEERYNYMTPPYSAEIKNVEKAQNDVNFTEQEREALRAWLAEYQEQRKINYITVQRHRDAATNLSFILVGLPLYLYHWQIIKKEIREKKEKIKLS